MLQIHTNSQWKKNIKTRVLFLGTGWKRVCKLQMSEAHTVLIASKLATKATSQYLSSGTTSLRSLPRKVKGSRMRTCVQLMSPKSPGLGSWEPAKVFSWNSRTAIKLASCSGLRPAAIRAGAVISTPCRKPDGLFSVAIIWRFARPIWNPFMVSFPYYSHIFRDPYGSGMGPIIAGLWTCHWHGVDSWHVLPVCCFDPWKYRLNTWHQSRSDIFFTQRYLRCTRNNAYIPENYHDKGKQPF